MEYIKRCLILLLLIVGTNLNSQTSDQTKSFVNRSHVAIAKVQKEIYRSGKNDFDVEIKKAIKYQVIALKMFKENKFSDAIAYSYKSRVQCIELCSKLSIISENYNPNEEERTYLFKGAFVTNPNLLDAGESKKIEELNILDVAKFLEIELSIK